MASSILLYWCILSVRRSTLASNRSWRSGSSTFDNCTTLAVWGSNLDELWVLLWGSGFCWLAVETCDISKATGTCNKVLGAILGESRQGIPVPSCQTVRQEGDQLAVALKPYLFLLVASISWYFVIATSISWYCVIATTKCAVCHEKWSNKESVQLSQHVGRTRLAHRSKA